MPTQAPAFAVYNRGMVEQRKKPGIGFWITVALAVVLVGYPLSWGPAALVLNSGDSEIAPQVYGLMYDPIIRVYRHGPRPVRHALDW
jgi:hypothetical protein